MASLRVTNGPSTGQRVQVETELFVGREGVDLVVDDPEMSRRHAAMRVVGGAIEVEDLGSSNGTFVNGERISGPSRVNGGEQIRCGSTVFEVLGLVPAQKTRISTVADADSGALAEPIADPQATRARPIAGPQATKARPVADPQATRARPIAGPEATRVRPIPDPQATRARPVARDRGQPALPPGAAPTPARGPPLPAPVATFTPPARGRSRGVASRSWVPAALSFGTVVIVAVALVIYFATR